MASISIKIPPFFIDVDGVPVEILEVGSTKIAEAIIWYHVSCRIHYKDIVSRVFTLDVKSEEELINKLKVEITKLKYIELVSGKDVLERLIR